MERGGGKENRKKKGGNVGKMRERWHDEMMTA